MRDLRLAVLEDGDVFLPVHRDADGLAQLAVAFFLGGVVALADHRIQPVETHVPILGLDRGRQLEPALGVQGRLLLGIAGRHQVGDAVFAPLGLGHVVVALQELALQRYAFLFDVEDDAVDEGGGFAAVLQQAGGAVLFRALAGIGIAAEIGIARQDVAAVLAVLRQHVRPGAHRPVVQGQVALGHAGLAVELVGFPGDGREEGHRQPVLELRVLALDPYAQRMGIQRLHAFEGVFAEVQPRQVARGRDQALAQLGVGGADAVAVLLETDDVVGHVRVDGRYHTGGGQAADAVDVVVGGQFARTGARKVRDGVLALQVRGGQVPVQVPAGFVHRERGVRLEPDAGLDRDVVDALHHLLPRHVVRQALALRVQVDRIDHLDGRPRRELVGPLQVVVAVQRLVDLVGVGGLVDRIGTGRVQVLGRALRERRVHDVLALGAGRVGAVQRRAAVRTAGRAPSRDDRRHRQEEFSGPTARALCALSQTLSARQAHRPPPRSSVFLRIAKTVPLTTPVSLRNTPKLPASRMSI